jgi:uncharacterized protein YjiS (DUF1127 family)
MTRRAITFTVTIPMPDAAPLLTRLTRVALLTRVTWAWRGLAGVRRLFGVWARRAVERRELSRMNAHQLHDIGVRADEGRREAEKPFWRL